MRWNDVYTLLSNSGRYQDEAGAWHEGEPEASQAFCNLRSVGAATWAGALDNGMRVDAEVEMRSVDYDGQPRVELFGDEYRVLHVTRSGDLVRLQLGAVMADA